MAQANENFAKRNAAIQAWQQKVKEENAALKEFRRIEDLARPRFNGRVMVHYATDAKVADAKVAYKARVRDAKNAKASIPSLPWLRNSTPCYRSGRCRLPVPRRPRRRRLCKRQVRRLRPIPARRLPPNRRGQNRLHPPRRQR